MMNTKAKLFLLAGVILAALFYSQIRDALKR